MDPFTLIVAGLAAGAIILIAITLSNAPLGRMIAALRPRSDA